MFSEAWRGRSLHPACDSTSCSEKKSTLKAPAKAVIKPGKGVIQNINWINWISSMHNSRFAADHPHTANASI